MNYTVGMSDMKISADRDDVLVTSSLGSCIGVTLYDPGACVGGMIHCMLPLSKIDPAAAAANPQMFTDTGIPALIEGMLEVGAQKQRLIAKAAGAAKLLDEKGTFKIGERNYIVFRKIMWKNHIPVAAEDTGGTMARTVYLYVNSGKTIVRSQGQERELA